MKFDVELAGSLTQVRTALEALGRRDACNAGRRALARVGAVACLGAAFGWGALELPGLIPVRTGLAILLTVCTVAAIRLAPKDFDPAIIAHLNRLLHELRQTSSPGKVFLKADLANTVAGRRLEIDLEGPSKVLEGFVGAVRENPHADLKGCSVEGQFLKVAFAGTGPSDDSEVGGWVDWFLARWDQAAQPA